MFYLLHKLQWNPKPSRFCCGRRHLLCNHNNGDIFVCEDNMIFHAWRYHVFSRGLNWYFIGFHLIRVIKLNYSPAIELIGDSHPMTLLLGSIELIWWCRGFHPPILFKDKNITVNYYGKELGGLAERKNVHFHPELDNHNVLLKMA